MVVGFCCSNGVVKLLAPHVIVVPPLVLVEAIEVIVLLEVMDLRRLKLAVVTVVAMEDIRKVCSLKVEKSRVKIRIWNTECIYCISRLGSLSRVALAFGVVLCAVEVNVRLNLQGYFFQVQIQQCN